MRLDRALEWRCHRRLGHHLFRAAGDKAGMDHAGRHDDDADLGAEHSGQGHAHRIERRLRGTVDAAAAAGYNRNLAGERWGVLGHLVLLRSFRGKRQVLHREAAGLYSPSQSWAKPTPAFIARARRASLGRRRHDQGAPWATSTPASISAAKA